MRFKDCPTSSPYWCNSFLTWEAALLEARVKSRVSSAYYKSGIRSPLGVMVGNRAGRLDSQTADLLHESFPTQYVKGTETKGRPVASLVAGL